MVAGIVVFVLGFPLLVTSALFVRFRTRGQEGVQQLQRQLGASCVLFLLSTSFKTCGTSRRFELYKERYFWWNSVSVARRIFINAVLAILGSSRALMFSLIATGEKPCLCSCWCIVGFLAGNVLFLFLHLTCQPFRDARSNRLETFSQLVLTVASAQLASYSDPLTSEQTTAFLIMLWLPLALLGIPVAARFLYRARNWQPPCCRCNICASCAACWKRWSAPALAPVFAYLVSSEFDPATQRKSTVRVSSPMDKSAGAQASGDEASAGVELSMPSSPRE